MNFASDNVTGVAPQIMDALSRANEPVAAMSYGADGISQRLDERFSALFETSVQVFPVATGTAANALSLSLLCPPFGSVYTVESSHSNEDECGAPEFYTGGAKLISMDGKDGKVLPDELDRRIAETSYRGVHQTKPSAVSITQATEAGTVYTPDEITRLATIARRRGLGLHMDGARFANAVAALGVSPAETTWRAGVDILSFGATKNGAMAAEAIVIFNPDLAETLGYRRKRSAHLFSKMRFLSAQLDAYIDNGLWLSLAAHANAMARRLSDGLIQHPDIEHLYPVEANLLFLRMPKALIEHLTDAGFVFFHWGDPARPIVRLVTAFNTEQAHVEALIDAANAWTASA